MTTPDGFEPVFNYPDGKTPVPVAGRLRHPESKLVFVEPYPALPLKSHGLLHHMGWDIPTRWAVDAKGQAWMDNAHGHPLHPVEPGVLVGCAETDSAKKQLRTLLGLPPEPAEWEQMALANGWKPPKGWKPT